MIAITNAGISDIPVIKQLADITWQNTYKNILTPEQLKYMLHYFYSEDALQKQMINGQEFLLINDDNKPIGFASYSILKIISPVTYKLHKLYIHPSQQGKNLGKLLLEDIINKAKSKNAIILEANVNRYNKALNFYLKNNFTIIKEEDVDIGNGYFQNDYVLQLKMNG